MHSPLGSMGNAASQNNLDRKGFSSRQRQLAPPSDHVRRQSSNLAAGERQVILTAVIESDEHDSFVMPGPLFSGG